jgi:hypothetical protein
MYWIYHLQIGSNIITTSYFSRFSVLFNLNNIVNVILFSILAFFWHSEINTSIEYQFIPHLEIYYSWIEIIPLTNEIKENQWWGFVDFMNYPSGWKHIRVPKNVITRIVFQHLIILLLKWNFTIGNVIVKFEEIWLAWNLG